ncbi:MAG: NarK/NasA family nitrate transporter [Bdellovibrionales bacterium]|nr:NarK/NasA family nitrate transporter [Bdellovibrionales bacterium]
MEQEESMTDTGSAPTGNSTVLWISMAAFSLGFGVWGMFSALGPFLIRWFHYTPSQALFLAAMPPLFASIISVPLGAITDRYGGRSVFTGLLVVMLLPLTFAALADEYVMFLIAGMLLGLGGASFVVGNAHVSSWYPQSKQGTALGIFALGNIGITLGMIFVPLLITKVFGGPVGNVDLPPKITFFGLIGWRLVFPVFAIPIAIMAIVYWTKTTDSPTRTRKKVSLPDIIAVCRSSTLWGIVFLYWVSFGTLTFFSAFIPTYLTDRWQIDSSMSSMVYTSIMVICIAFMRPVGGWLSDRFNPLKLLAGLMGTAIVFVIMLVIEFSFVVQITSIYALALLAGASAATVVKLIPTYFPTTVGTVSGLAKAAGAACGFVMSSTMAIGKNFLGGYTFGFIVWAAMNIAAFIMVKRATIWRKQE